jgi:hypothetical protein
LPHTLALTGEVEITGGMQSCARAKLASNTKTITNKVSLTGINLFFIRFSFYSMSG